MSVEIDNFIGKGQIKEAIEQCYRENQNNLGKLISMISTVSDTSVTAKSNTEISNDKHTTISNTEIFNDKHTTTSNTESTKVDTTTIDTSIKYTRVMLLCNWLPSEELCKIWNKMSKGNFIWNNIKLVSKHPVDYFVVINSVLHTNFMYNINTDLEKTILFRMEPDMDTTNIEKWGFWANPTRNIFKFAGFHDVHYNNLEWHISKTYTELTNENIDKNSIYANILSTVLSDKYNDPGHIKRVDFVKFLESKDFIVDVYGSNSFKWRSYKGALPYHQKDDALLPYKYTFNVENRQLKNYMTEKLVDGIISECLTFYHGCPNVGDYIDERAFVYLELIDFENDYNIIRNAIENNLWEERLPYIKAAKSKILNELSFFPRLEKIIN
jgi:hypothetical protein|uniref:Glycosyltransferase n=1 Tax=viral metagenome TaxID=1070528 RepID=A0A6C0CZ49_9ZZZZ